ncbi:TolC family protein, partial [bacterium]|nr:TolC family protein [candidate division CSSED10-310 bacterium]
VLNHDGILDSITASERADLAARRLQVKAAEQSIRIARAGYWPTISLGVDAGTSVSDSSDESFGTQITDLNPYAAMGVNLNLPLYDRHSTRHAMAEAKLNLTQQQIQLAQLEQQAAIEARQAAEDHESAMQKLTAARATLEYAREAVQTQEERYSVNAATLVEVSQARVQFRNAQYEEITATCDLAVKRLALAYSRGDRKALLIMVGIPERIQTATAGDERGDS